MSVSRLVNFLLALSGLFIATSVGAVESGQVQDFQDGLLGGWSEGGASPNPPTNEPNGGPNGDGDRFLQNVASGTAFGGGGKPVMFNLSAWSGDFVSAGVIAVRMRVKVIDGTLDANIRVAFNSSGGTQLASTEGVVVPNDGQWHDILLPIFDTALTTIQGSESYEDAMSSVTEMRIMDALAPTWRPNPKDITLGFDNITAVSPNFIGWIWDSGVLYSPGINELEEEACFGPILLAIADDDTWVANGTEEICWSRLTTDTVPPRNWFGYDGTNFTAVESYVTRSTRPLTSAGGNLLEVYGEDVEDDVGLGEERFGTYLAEPSDSDYLIAAGYSSVDEPFFGESYGFVYTFIKSTADVVASRTASDLLGTWRMTQIRKGPSRTNVAQNLALLQVRSVDLEVNGNCTFTVPSVIQDPDYDTNGESYFGVQIDAGTGNLTDRGVVGGLSDSVISNCTWEIDPDGRLHLTFDADSGSGPETVDQYYSVSDDHNYLIHATNPAGAEDYAASLFTGFRSGTLASDALDGNYLFHLTITEYEATGTQHSEQRTGDQNFDAYGRGLISFDSTTTVATPTGQAGSWNACNMDLEQSMGFFGSDGDPSAGGVTSMLGFESENSPIVGCAFQLSSDGSLLVSLVVQDSGSPAEDVLLAGYASANGEIVSIVDVFSEPMLSGGAIDFVSLRHVLAMQYTGDPFGNDDGDRYDNVQEFQLPVTAGSRQQGIVGLPDVNSNGAADVGVVMEGSTRVHVRDGSTGELISDINYGDDIFLDIAVIPDLDSSNDPEIAVLQERDTGVIRALIKDSATGDTTGNVFFGDQFSGIDMAVVSDFSGNLLPELAVLGQQDGTDRIRIQIRDAATNAGIRSVFLGDRMVPKHLVTVGPETNNIDKNLATMGVVKATNQIMSPIRDAEDSSLLQTVFWADQFEPVATTWIPDINTSFGPRELVALGRDPNTGAGRLQIRDSALRTPLTTVFLGDLSEVLDVAVVSDTNANSLPDIAVLSRQSSGAGLVRVYDSGTGTLLKNVFYNSLSNAVGFAVLADFSGNGFDEIAVLGQDGSGVRQVQIKDSVSGSFVSTVDFP